MDACRAWKVLQHVRSGCCSLCKEDMKSTTIYKTHYDTRSHERNGVSQPGWVIDDCVHVVFSYVRPYDGYPAEVYKDVNGNEYIKVIGPFGTGPERFLDEQVARGWMRAGLDRYYKCFVVDAAHYVVKG